MLKKEFEELIGMTISDREYKIIETVREWYPVMRNVSGMEEVAELYKSFGMAIFYDIYPRAERTQELDRLLHRAQKEVDELKNELEELTIGNVSRAKWEGIDCIVQHFQTFYNQASIGLVANFAEPCQKCPHIENCNLDWLSKMKPLFTQTTFPVNVSNQVPPEKQDKDQDV